MLIVNAHTDNNFLAISADFRPAAKSKKRGPADLLAALRWRTAENGDLDSLYVEQDMKAIRQINTIVMFSLSYFVSGCTGPVV